jgi:hypothetical protein
MRSYFKKLLIILFLVHNNNSIASGGYDNGTPAGKGHLDIDITYCPTKYIKYGQSYIVWGYGLTKRIDFHGYASRSASGINQIYCGFMYNFLSKKYLDLSTAFGLRFMNGAVHSYFPQLLYTIKLPKGFDIIGSNVLVSYTSEKYKNVTSYKIARDVYKMGITYDIALRIPLPIKKMPAFIKQAKFAIGAFRGVSRNWYPTYSIDLHFNLSKQV